LLCILGTVGLACLAAPSMQATTRGAGDPFGFFQPDVSISASDRANLDRGQTVVRTLPSPGDELAVFAAMPLNATPDRVLAWMENITALKKNQAVVAIGRFSSTPRIEDLAALTLDDGDVQTVRKCKPNDCGIKLTADEIGALQTAFGAARSSDDEVQDTFRRLVLARVLAYGAGPTGHDDSPAGDTVGGVVDSFTYWSKERFSGKPIISATHVRIRKPDDPTLPAVVVEEQQIFATHYVDRSSSLVAMLRGGESTAYLAYLNRSHVDLLKGGFGRLVRFEVEHRLKSQAPDELRTIRERIESGPPPLGSR
jgi:hypothetical protein